MAPIQDTPLSTLAISELVDDYMNAPMTEQNNLNKEVIISMQTLVELKQFWAIQQCLKQNSRC